MRAVVDGRRARIVVGDEAVDVRFASGELLVEPAGAVGDAGAVGRDRAGRLDVTGHVDDVERMFLAIEILVDVAARAPALQDLAADYRADPCREPRRAPPPPPAPTGRESERELLDRLGLLPFPAA